MEENLPAKRPREAFKYKMDEKGRLIDESGKELETSAKNRLSLDVNKERFEKKKKKSKQYSLTKAEKKPRGAFFDKNLPKKKVVHRSSLLFTNSSKTLNLVANVTPLIEWWDRDLTNSYNEKYNEEALKEPVKAFELPCPGQLNSTTHLVTMHLTPKEKKKLKRLKKLNKQKEMQDKIKLGLIEAPQAKTKLANLMKIMSKELALDPSKTEQEIMEKYNKRIEMHLKRNEENKLNHKEKVERTLRKLRRDSARETRVAVFKFEFFSSAKIRFKIMKNANQLALVGVCLIPPPSLPGIIIVQGGKRALKFFSRLCLHRIQWESGKCEQVWTSEIKEANFFKFKLVNVENEVEIKRILDKKGSGNYWDLVINSSKAKEILI